MKPDLNGNLTLLAKLRSFEKKNINVTCNKKSMHLTANNISEY